LFKLIFGSLLILTIVVSGAWMIPQAFAPGPPLGWVAHPPIHARPFATTVPTGLFPSAVEHAYGLDQLSCSLGTTSTSWTDPSLCGHGQALAIVDAYDDPTAESDLGAFSNYFGLPACTSSNGCFAKAMPQGQPITSAGWGLEISLDIQWAHAIAPGARILLVEAGSNSFSNLLGAVNYGASQSGYPVHQVSMSWGGSEFSYESLYDSYFSVSGVSFFASSGDSGNGPIWPSASPYVIGVGGTTLQADTLTETAWSGSGGGISLYESEPSFQSKYPIPNTGGARGVPDVSYDADPNTGVSVYDSTPYNGQSGWFVIGGTSVGAPSWNAIFAIVNSKRSSPISSVSFSTGITLYGAATGSVYTNNYRDIKSGSNGNCGFVCNAQTGYDFVTGLGSPLANNLVPYLQPSTTPTLSLSANPSSITTSQSSTITASTNDGKDGVVISFSLVSGSVGSLSPNACSTSSGQCAVTFSSATAGSATVTASASGYNSAQTTVTVTQPPTPSLVVSANPTTITTSQTSTITASTSDIKNGVIVSFSSNIGALNPATCTTDSSGKCSATFSSSATGTATITASATGYTSAQTTVTVNSATNPTLSVSVTTNRGSYKAGQIVTITATVTSSGTAVSGATVSIAVYYPDGSKASSVPDQITGSNGKATFRYLVTTSAPKGTYTAVATATLTGYTSGSGSTTFKVR
jgi:subtilase family serine protease